MRWMYVGHVKWWNAAIDKYDFEYEEDDDGENDREDADLVSHIDYFFGSIF